MRKKKKKKAAKAATGEGGQVAAKRPRKEKADELEALRAERDNLLERLQRVSADYVNYQKRVQRDITEAREFANAELVKSLLPVLDDMERALASARENHGEDDPPFEFLSSGELVHGSILWKEMHHTQGLSFHAHPGRLPFALFHRYLNSPRAVGRSSSLNSSGGSRSSS